MHATTDAAEPEATGIEAATASTERWSPAPAPPAGHLKGSGRWREACAWALVHQVLNCRTPSRFAVLRNDVPDMSGGSEDGRFCSGGGEQDSKGPVGVFSIQGALEDEVSLREWMALKDGSFQVFDSRHHTMATGSAPVGHIGQTPCSWGLFKSLSMPSNGAWQAASGVGGIQDPRNLQMGESNSLQVLAEVLRNKTRQEMSAMMESPASIYSVAAGNVANMMAMPVSSCGPRTGPVRDPVQGFTDTMLQKDGSVELRMTQVVAGFVIGIQGVSIRSISQQTGAEIYSWSENPGNRRVFEIKGSPKETAHAVWIIISAVQRYKDLTEGNQLGKFVDPVQNVQGVKFLYRPPPKHRVPHAASVTNSGSI